MRLPASLAMLAAATLLSVSLIVSALLSRPRDRYQMWHDNGAIYRLDSHTGQIMVCGAGRASVNCGTSPVDKAGAL